MLMLTTVGFTFGTRVKIRNFGFFAFRTLQSKKIEKDKETDERDRNRQKKQTKEIEIDRKNR